MRKHIVFLSEHLALGGAEVVLTQYLQYIDKDKYRVSLILRNDLGAENYLLARVPSDVKVIKIFSRAEINYFDDVPRDSSFKSKKQRRLRRNEQKKMLLERFDQAFSELKPDVVIDFSPVLNRYRGHFKKYKFVLWMHGEKSHMGFWERTKYLIRMNQYQRVVLLCEEMKDQFIKLFPLLRHSKYAVIYNPFDFDRIKKMANDDSELTAEDRELMQQKYVVSIGRLVPGKDFRTIIEAVRLLKERGFEYTHYILGAGELESELKDLIEKYKLGDRLRMLGPRKNPYVWMKNSQMFVHSALREGLPTVVIEAMVLNVPVIACTCPTGPREILENGKSGALYSVGDAQKLADQIQRILPDEKLKNDYLAASAKQVQIFSAENVMPKFYSLVDQCCKL